VSSRLIVAGLISLSALHVAAAQTGTTDESPFAAMFILPVGARNLGMGMAAVATATGSEAVWWNPALVARGERETAVHVLSQLIPGSAADLAASLVWPLPPVGAIAIGARYINEGTQAATNDQGLQTGTFILTQLAPTVTFATTFDRVLTAGFTLKRLIISMPCTGDCGPNLPPSASVNALDAGSQLFMTKDSSISLAVAVRNIGPRVQIKDQPQADPLPSRGSAGVAYTPKLSNIPDVHVQASAEIVTRLVGGGSPGYRFGAEATYRGLYSGRAGYMIYGPGDLSTATLGFGIHSGKLQIDFAELMSDLGGTGARPTLISLRYVF
jgi:hypothetical protein